MYLFFLEGIDNSKVNQRLLELFPDRFDLCAEFKRLYIYGHEVRPAFRHILLNLDLSACRSYLILKLAVKDRGLRSDPANAICEEDLS